MTSSSRTLVRRAGLAALLFMLPLALQAVGLHWVRVADACLLYVVLALGLNVVVGYAGLLDLGYVAFYALGAYLFALLTSPHLTEQIAWIAAWSPGGLHTPLWVVIPLAAVLAALLGMLLGAPTLKLRGDYLAVVTLGFGEIVRLLIINMDRPVNITNGAKGIGQFDNGSILGIAIGRSWNLGGHQIAPITQYFYLLLLLVFAAIFVSHRLQASRIGRAWRAIGDDETAATAMGINSRNLKLLAFGVGASFGGVSGVMFASLQGFVSPEAFTLQESVLILAMVVFGGMGHIRGVILGAVVLAALPEVLRYVVVPLQEMSAGRFNAGVMRPLTIAVAMVLTMLWRSSGLWPSPDPAQTGAAAR
ncbi:ABC transporter permease subunit [Hydrogenophaga sp. RWCD_12]|uniref:ABC transporter permease subunit n=1 Tax=Hydrogenophaga sp. RWCD_12 TaxID=3391190 RepID=UPI003984B5F9